MSGTEYKYFNRFLNSALNQAISFCATCIAAKASLTFGPRANGKENTIAALLPKRMIQGVCATALPRSFLKGGRIGGFASKRQRVRLVGRESKTNSIVWILLAGTRSVTSSDDS